MKIDSRLIIRLPILLKMVCNDDYHHLGWSRASSGWFSMIFGCKIVEIHEICPKCVLNLIKTEQNRRLAARGCNLIIPERSSIDCSAFGMLCSIGEPCSRLVAAQVFWAGGGVRNLAQIRIQSQITREFLNPTVQNSKSEQRIA